MATGKITKRSVDAASVGFLWDDELRGFGLRVASSGARSYVYQYRMGGREAVAKRFTIGRHGSPWTPVSARQEATRIAMMVRQGIDPRASQRETRRQAVDLAFTSYAARFLERYVKVEAAASYAFAEGILRLHITPVFQSRALSTIARSDITEMLDRIPPAKVALRRNVYAVIRRLFRWAVGRGDLERSPMDGFEAPPNAISRDRVLNDRELALVWKAIGLLGAPFDSVMRLLICTGQRREEVAAMEWSELDRATLIWTLPASRSKNGKAHLVPLNELAVATLDYAASSINWPTKGFVFTTTGKTAVSGHSRAKARLDRLLSEREGGNEEIAPWRVHDIRRTVATGLQRLGIRFEVTEAILNHVSGARSGVAGVYQRHDWAAEKCAALAAWGRHVSQLTAEPDVTNVVAMRAA